MTMYGTAGVTESEEGSSRCRRLAGAGGLTGIGAPTCLAVGILALLPGVLVAQEERDTTRAAEDSVRYRLQGITVEASRPTTTAGGASALQVRLDSMVAMPAPTLGEILESMPLIRVRRNSRGQQQPSLRGVEERQIAVLVDGIPITLGWDNRTDLSVVPLNAAREVTMVRGLSSVLAGPNALGGVVMVGITEGPRPRSLRRPFRARAAVDHVGGVSLDGEAGGLWEPGHSTLLVRGGGGFRDSPGLVRPGGVRTPTAEDDLLLNTDFASRNAFVSGRWWGRTGEWISVSALAHDTEKGVLPELHISDPRLWRIPDQWRSLTAVSAGTGWRDTPFGQGDVEAMVGLDFGHTEIDSFDSFAFDDAAGGQVDDDRTLTFRLLADHTLGPGMLRSAFTYAETHHEQRESGRPALDFEQHLWSVGVEVEEPLGGLLGLTGGTVSRPTVNAGFSLDGSSTPVTGDKPPREGIDGWGARATGSVHLGGAVRLHGGLSRKVRFPALRELFSGALGKFEPNPGLGPEVLEVAEVGVTGSVGLLEAQAAIFEQRLGDAIVRTTTDDGKLRRENRNEIRSRGLEVVANWRAGPVSVGGDLTLQDVELDDPTSPETERVEYQPEILTGLQIHAPGPFGVLARASLQHEGRQFCVDPEGGFDRIDPNVSFDLGVRRELPAGWGGLPGLIVSASATNITDEAIFEQCGLPSGGRTFRFQLELR